MDCRTETDAGVFKKTVERVLHTVNTPKYELEAPSITSTESFGTFFERPQYLLDSLEYPRNGDDPGLVLIFNQEHFDGNSPTREGSSKDVEAIATCLGRLGFNIKKSNIFQDLSKKEIFREVDEILKTDLSKTNSLLVFIMSHGENCNLIRSRTNPFQLEDLLVKFESCSDLKGKPKMFVIQACKGGDKTVLTDEKKDILLVPLSTFGRLHQDTVIVYSTIEGRYSYRHREYGSWLIQEICKNFSDYGRRDDVLTMLTRVIKCTCTIYFLNSYSESEVQKQVPVVVSSLSRKFYLNTNKDRHFALQTLNMQIQYLEYLKRQNTRNE